MTFKVKTKTQSRSNDNFRVRSQTYLLEPQYDSAKSFYKKAKVIRENGKITLRSYNTDVAEIKNGRAVVHGTYSQTTLRHIKEFLKQHGFKAETSKQIIRDYGERDYV